jgi:hypothetical protein
MQVTLSYRKHKVFIHEFFYLNIGICVWFGDYPVYILVIKYLIFLDIPKTRSYPLQLSAVLTVFDGNTIISQS